MSKLADLLDPTVAEKMKAVATATALVADVTPEEPAQQHRVLKGRKGEPDIRILKESTSSRPTQLRASQAIKIDARSEALIEAKCVDCGVGFTVDPTELDPDFFEDEDKLYFPLCIPHATIREQYKAMDNQRQVEITRRTENEKEQDVDLDNLSDAEFGASVRKGMKAEKAEKIKAAKPVVEAERRKADKKDKKACKERQATHKIVLPGFTVPGRTEATDIVVPALDLGVPASLDEAPSGVERSPYNKARLRLLGLKEALDPETTTYKTLRALHTELQELNGQAKKSKKAVVVADVDPSDQAKRVKALVKAGFSEKKARKIAKEMA